MKDLLNRPGEIGEIYAMRVLGDRLDLSLVRRRVIVPDHEIDLLYCQGGRTIAAEVKNYSSAGSFFEIWDPTNEIAKAQAAREALHVDEYVVFFADDRFVPEVIEDFAAEFGEELPDLPLVIIHGTTPFD